MLQGELLPKQTFECNNCKRTIVINLFSSSSVFSFKSLFCFKALQKNKQTKTKQKTQRNSKRRRSGNQDKAPNVKGIRIPESGKFLLVESGILGLEIRNTAEKSGNPLTTRIQNPSSIDAQWETLESIIKSGIHGVEYKIQDGLEFPYIAWIKIWKFCPILTLATFGGKNVKSVKVQVISVLTCWWSPYRSEQFPRAWLYQWTLLPVEPQLSLILVF